MQSTMCLNMIVKNESHIIQETLEMLCSKIQFNYWVICDTGSTDDTREIIIQFFKEKRILGELHCDEWVDFAHNRTLALERAFNKTDLLLVFDADDELHGTIHIPDKVEHDEYHLKFGQPNSGMNYTRTQLINNRKRFKYFSVLHEYISCQEPTPARICILGGDYYLISGRRGARNNDPNKYLNDATILAKAHAESLTNGDDLYKRYAFYCANSYRDCGKYEDAIKWYKTTLSQDNWLQEKYLACLYMYQCYDALKQPHDGFFYLVKAFSYDSERVECLYPLLVHYCCEEMHEMAYNYYRMVKMPITQNNAGKLFVETDKAGFLVPYYMIIVADRVRDRECGIRMYEIIFKTKHRTFSAWHLRNLMFNLRFFIEHVKPEAVNAFAALANDYLKFVIDNGVPASTFDGLALNVNPRPVVTQGKIKSKTCKKSRNILFYTGYCNAEWNYSQMKVGALGGSEKAVAYLSKELGQLLKAANGYTVYVAGQVRAEELAEFNVKYVGLNDLPDLLSKTEFHTVICSRYISFLEIYGSACSFYQFYIWAHDTRLLPYGCSMNDVAIIEKWADRIDGCVCQTQWHADQYTALYPALKTKMSIINNGIDLELFPTSQVKQLGKFIYTSRTERGLTRILELWPEIVAALPTATLAVSTYEVFPCNDEERRVQTHIESLNREFPDNRIQHLGKLNPTQLYAEMSTAEYWLYPTNWPETSCITAMEMLMSGVICLYYPVAGLTYTMNGCGMQIFPGSEIQTLVVTAHDEGIKEALRKQGRAYAESCGWATRAQQWESALALNSSNANKLDFKTVVINLKRRPDRKAEMEAQLKRQNFTDYEFMDAVDGKELVATEYIYELFKGNNFQYRKGVIGCSMSHIELWKQLIDDPTCDVYAIIEDDAKPVDDFELKLQKAVKLFASEPSAELCFIGGFSITVPCENANNLQIIKHPREKKKGPVEGTGGYIIKKSGATRFLNYCKTRSMVTAIDWYILGIFNEHLYSVNEYLLYTFGIDTDIQSSVDGFSFPSAETDMTRTNTRANTDHRNQNNIVVTVAFCDWWFVDYGGGNFNVNDNFLVNLIKTHIDVVSINGVNPHVKVIEPSQNPDILFYSIFGGSNDFYRAGRKVFFSGEPHPHRTDADFNITFDASNDINVRLPLWVWVMDDTILKPRQYDNNHKREKFCSYIASGHHDNRQMFVEKLSSQYKPVDCGGGHLNNIGGEIPRGTNASGKIEHNKQYKFAMAFENNQYPGCVTEKICDVYKSGCIPIYWGTPDVTQDFNPSTFINANDFPDFDALIDHIRRVDCDDELYASYFKDPILSDAWVQIFSDPNHTFFKQIVSDIFTFDI